MGLKNESEIVFLVTVKGKEKEQTCSCILQNFLLEGMYEGDLQIREDMPLPGGLVHASGKDILEKLFDEVKLEAIHYQKKADECTDEKERTVLLALADALENLDYNKIETKLERVK